MSLRMHCLETLLECSALVFPPWEPLSFIILVKEGPDQPVMNIAITGASGFHRRRTGEPFAGGGSPRDFGFTENRACFTQNRSGGRKLSPIVTQWYAFGRRADRLQRWTAAATRPHFEQPRAGDAQPGHGAARWADWGAAAGRAGERVGRGAHYGSRGERDADGGGRSRRRSFSRQCLRRLGAGGARGRILRRAGGDALRRIGVGARTEWRRASANDACLSKWAWAGALGSGRQWMSWIHLDDLIALIEFAVATPGLRGPVNATAPRPVTNAEFTRDLAAALHRPAIFPVPAFVLKLLFGEMSQVLLEGQRVIPAAALERGIPVSLLGCWLGAGRLVGRPQNFGHAHRLIPPSGSTQIARRSDG